MIRRTTVLPLGLLLATTACSNVLGIKDDSKAADCLVDKDCKQSGQICVDYRCEDSDTASGGSSSDLIGNGAKGGKTSKSSGGSSATTSSARTGGTSSGIGGSSVGGVSAAGGTSATGGTTNVASGGNTAAGAGGLSGATTPVGGTSGSGGATTAITSSSGGNTTLGGSTSSGGTTTTTSSSGGTTDVGGTTGTGGSTETTGGAGGTTSSSGGFTNAGGTAGTGGGSSSVPVCTPGTYKCVYYDDASPRVVNAATCKSNGQWSDEVLCPDYCDEAEGCVSAPSCVGLNGCSGNISCCNSLSLPEGEFNRSIPENGVTDCSADSPCPATVSAFRLDTFEVSVARFRKFVEAYEIGDALYRPAPGDGKNPNSADDTGWRTEWNELLPESREKLEAMIENPACGAYLYTESTGVNERKPINCIDWYVASAFCIWDGGRLPTEVEWNYAAAGGDQDRYYPWSYPATAKAIDAEYATYRRAYVTPAATQVGATSKGMSRWGQYDLAGNMYEWVFDVYAETYPANTECRDCAVAGWTANSPDPISRVLRGGGYTSAADGVAAAARSYDEEANSWADIGFRCARDF